MSNSNTIVPSPENEPILSYAPGSPERKEVLKTYKKLYNTPIEVPLFIGGKKTKRHKKVSGLKNAWELNSYLDYL